MAAKAPYMPFYVGDWLGSTHVDCMTLEEQGAYMRLLCHCWASGNASIPDDDNLLSGISRMGKKWFKKNSKSNSESIIRKCFVPHPSVPNCLTNEKVLKLHLERLEYLENQAANGRKSAEKRRKLMSPSDLGEDNSVNKVAENINGGSTTVHASLERSYQPNANSSSSSSKTSSKKEENKTKEESVIEENRKLKNLVSKSLTFPSAIHGRAEQWYRLYPLQMKPDDVPPQWSNAVYQISIENECDEDRAADILDEITLAFGKSPAGQPPPAGVRDFRPYPANWLKSGMYRSCVDRKQWEVPNGGFQERKIGHANATENFDFEGFVHMS